MSGGRKLEQVALECRECGNRQTIWRKKSRLKEPGHVKHLWCICCEDRTAHVEIREDRFRRNT